MALFQKSQSYLKIVPTQSENLHWIHLDAVRVPNGWGQSITRLSSAECPYFSVPPESLRFGLRAGGTLSRRLLRTIVKERFAPSHFHIAAAHALVRECSW
ncbi:MAG: hypothetical protein KatS3mg130_0232 [Candidatus Sumerlaea sp.]|nr:MAG: hypothetical protein KatS3mg130_0232 [Candidatus Sumerlaea sp.]